MIFLMIIAFFVFIVLGLPIAFSMGISASIYILINDIPLPIIAQKFFTNTQSFPFLAVPFFILAGNLMVQSGLSRRLIKFVNSIFGRLPGGLGVVSCIVSMVMAGVSGSSVADAASTGSILIPEMKRTGYSSSFSAAVNAASSVVGIIIPPSSTMIIIAWMTNLSIIRMFFAGAIPGLLIGTGFTILTIIISKRRNFPREPKVSFKEFFISLLATIWILILPVFLLGSLLFGIATVTEIAAVSAIYALIIGVFVYKSLNWEGLKKAMIDSAKGTTIVMILVCCANIFTWVIISEGVPKMIGNALLSLGLPNSLLLFIMLIILFISGMLMDNIANIMIFLPIYMPIVLEMGMDPIHFCIVLLISLALGLFTPPVGATLFISCHIAKIGIDEVYMDLIPYFIVSASIVILVAFIPALSLWLPNLLGL